MRKVCILFVVHTYITPTRYAQPDLTYNVQIQAGQNLCLLSKTLLLITPLQICAFVSVDLKYFDVTVCSTSSSTESRAQMDGKQQTYIAAICI